MECSGPLGINFRCPRYMLDDSDDSYCCGQPGGQYCCDSEDYFKEGIRTLGEGAIVIIVIAVLIAAGIVVLLCCCCCSCCWLAKRRQRSSGVVLTPPVQTTTTVTTFPSQGYSQVPQSYDGSQPPMMQGPPYSQQYPGAGYPSAAPYPTQPYPTQPYPPQPMPQEYSKPPPYTPN